MIEILYVVIFVGLFVACVWRIGKDFDEAIKGWRDGD